jgi:hypothetical protein
MSDVGHWVERGARVRSLVPEVHAWAVSPDDAWIAWTEHRRDHVVHVTEISSWRTVVTLPGAPTAALRWTSPSTLVTLRRAHRNATLHAYAIPDGGEVAQSLLADVGTQRGEIDASADGGVMLIGALTRDGWLDGRASSRSIYLVRGELCDDVSRVDPFDLALSGSASLDHQGRCALSPDGRAIAVVRSAPKPSAGDTIDVGPSSVSFLSLATGAIRTYAVRDAGTPTHLVWASPTSVVAAFLDERWGTVLYRLHEVGGRDLVTRFDRNDRIRPEASLDLHPDRGRVLVTVERATDRERSNVRSVALVVGLSTDGTAQTETLGLGRDRGPSSRDRSGGACWDAKGRLLTLTHPRPGEGLLARRDAVLVPPENLAEVPLDGASPQALSLAVSPRASLALASWRAPLNDVGDTAKRLAIVSLP